VKKSTPRILDLLMRACDRSADLVSAPARFPAAGEGALPPAQSALVPPDDVGIRDDFPGGQDGEIIEPGVDADIAGFAVVRGGRQSAVKADIPAFRIAAEHAGFYLRTFGERAVHMHAQATGEALESEPFSVEANP